MPPNPPGDASSSDVDSALMLRLKNDDSALNVIIERWSVRIASFIYKITGSHALAEDLAQETFVKLYQARDRYQAKGAFSSYLFGIAANLVKNHRRWQSRHPTVSLDDPEFDDSDMPSPSISSLADPLKSAEAAEKLQTILKAILSLPVDLREAITLFMDEELSHAEIAAALGCTPKAVETRIYRARQILKIKLAAFAHQKPS